MATPATSLRQMYEIRAGKLEIKLSTEAPLTVQEAEEFQVVLSACEQFAGACPPELPEVKAARLGAEARAAEFKG